MKKIIFLLLTAIALFAYDSTIEIVKKIDKAPKIAVVDATKSGVDAVIKRKFIKLLIGDLKVSSHFIVHETQESGAYEGSNIITSLKENNVELSLKCKLEYDDSKRLLASAKLINAQNGDLIYEKFYVISKSERYPFLAHKITIDANKYLGAPSIDWMEKFVIFAKYTKKGQSKIVVSDYTLSFQKTIISGGLNIFPKWASDKQEAFYYTSYNDLYPTLYKVNLYSGKKTKIAKSPGMLVCSDVSRDGKNLLLTMAPSDQPDIYLYNAVSKKKQKITNYRGIDVSGSFVDNESKVVFISDRLGYPNVFSKKIGSNSVEQMIYHGKNNSSCSSYDKYIVYSSRETNSAFGRNTFNLYLISTETDYIRKLTTNGKNLFPRFADDGETILFIKHMQNQSALGIIRLNENKSYLFPLKVGKIQSIDW